MSVLHAYEFRNYPMREGVSGVRLCLAVAKAEHGTAYAVFVAFVSTACDARQATDYTLAFGQKLPFREAVGFYPGLIQKEYMK